MLKFGEDACETANFVEKMDRFFDCFNVSSFTAGKKNENHFWHHTVAAMIFNSRYVCVFMFMHVCL